MGLCYQRLGNLPAALDSQNDAVKIAERLTTPDLTWRVRYGRGRTYELMTCFDKAREDYKRSIEAVEETRGQIIQEAHRISFFGVDKMRVYRDLILLLVRREQIRDLQAGLEFAERSKTRSFLDSLALTPLSAPVSLPLGLVQKERALIEEYRTLLDA